MIESRWKKYLSLHSWGKRLPFLWVFTRKLRMNTIPYLRHFTTSNWVEVKMCSKIHLEIGRKSLENCCQKQTFTSSFYLSWWFVVAYFAIWFLEVFGSCPWNLKDLIGTWNVVNVHDVLGRIMEEKGMEMFLHRTNYWEWCWTKIVRHKDFRNILENHYWTIPWQ